MSRLKMSPVIGRVLQIYTQLLQLKYDYFHKNDSNKSENYNMKKLIM